MYAAFQREFYPGCTQPALSQLTVRQRWSGQGSQVLTFPAPTGTYFLVLATEPTDLAWRLDGVIGTGQVRQQDILHVDSSILTETDTARRLCAEALGGTKADTLYVQTTGLKWTIYLVATGGSDPLNDRLRAALARYYNCPALPPPSTLEVIAAWDSRSVGVRATRDFVGSPPYYFLGVKVEPTSLSFQFRSIVSWDNKKVAGPWLGGDASARMDFTFACPSAPTVHQLLMEGTGGNWTAYVIGPRH